MKNNPKISKPNNRPTSILMQLLHWLTHLELAGGLEGELHGWHSLPELSINHSIRNIKQIIINN